MQSIEFAPRPRRRRREAPLVTVEVLRVSPLKQPTETLLAYVKARVRFAPPLEAPLDELLGGWVNINSIKIQKNSNGIHYALLPCSREGGPEWLSVIELPEAVKRQVLREALEAWAEHELERMKATETKTEAGVES